jgi:protein TonB
VAIAVAAHAVAVTVLVLIPLLESHALPLPPINSLPLPAPRIPDTRPIQVFRGHAPIHVTPIANTLTEPTSTPSKIVISDDSSGPAMIGLLPAASGSAGQSLSGLPNSNATDFTPAPPEIVPLPPPPPPVIKTAKPVVIGGGIQAAKLIQQVKPVYPALARQARVQGVVVMEAVIGKGGSVENLRVISGHPLLSQSALDAVQQWKYRPTLLNGEPVEVLTTITVTFTLQ